MNGRVIFELGTVGEERFRRIIGLVWTRVF